jgi:hypothetical protein
MAKQEDSDELKNHIRQLFENYEDNGADEGWLLLRNKFPGEPKPRVPAWYWWVAAASLLLIIGFAFWQGYSTSDKPTLITNAKTTHHESTITPEHFTTDARKKPDNGLITAKNDQQKNRSIKPGTKTNENPAVAGFNRINNTDKKRVNHVHAETEQEYAETTETGKETNELPPAKEALGNPTITATASNPQSSALLTPQQQQQKKDSAFLKVLEKDHARAMLKKDSSVKDKMEVILGVYAATFANYSRGSSNNVAIAGGGSIEFRLNKNLIVSTGLAVNQNSLSYSNSLPTREATGNFIDIATKNVVYGAATPSNLGTLAVSYAPNIKNLNASLIAIDLPINFKYLIIPAKTDAFISVGISSGMFAQENYNYTYNYSDLVTTASQTVSTHNSFNDFYFADVLNLSLGVGYPLGKYNRLIVEPFLKYPLNGLGSQELRFGSGGISFKLNFLPRKK